MAFWRVAGFSQPSPIEQILDKEDFTLEELLDEPDVIQECKSLNGRLIAFLREKDVVEQLLKYLVQPASDADDPKRQYKYPFTACEVFCCEVEAIFNTLLEDEALLDLLFSLLDSEPPLDCKAAGYFARVVGQLLLRKTSEMMQYLSNRDGLLEKLVGHLEVTSIADVIKRLAGADEQSAMAFLPMHTQWLVETPLLDMLLARLGPGYSSDAAGNAADILTAIAHSQPSALAEKLMQPPSISALFGRALAPGAGVLVPALEVAAALLEPRRALGLEVLSGSPGSGGFGGGESDANPAASPTAMAAAAAAAKPRADALRAMLVYLPQLVSFLASADADATQETPYGMLAPPLGRARLKVVELLAVLLHAGGDDVDAALIAANGLGLALDLFAQYPFNNLLHHQVFYMLRGALSRASPAMVEHALGTCRLAAWLGGLPTEVTPTPRPGGPAPKGPMRAGYLGHVTRIGNLLGEAAAAKPAVAAALEGDAAWAAFSSGPLRARNEVEDVAAWACGRPASTEMGELGSDDYQNDMDLEQMQGMQPALYHRYGVLDADADADDDDSDEEHSGSSGAAGGGGGGGDFSGNYGSMLAAALQNMAISDNSGDSSSSGGGGSVLADVVMEREAPGVSNEGGSGGEGGNWSLPAHPGAAVGDGGGGEVRSAEDDDAVLLSTSDDEEGGGAAAGAAGGSPGPVSTPAAAVEGTSSSGEAAAAEGAAAAAGAEPAGAASSSTAEGTQEQLAAGSSSEEVAGAAADKSPAAAAAAAEA